MRSLGARQRFSHTDVVQTPEHYRPFYRLFLRFALIMLVYGGVAGILFQELTHSLKYADIGPGVRLEGVYHLALLHGHAFLIGAVMPICWVAALHVALAMDARPVSARALRWIAWTYLPGAVSVVGLITYKGMHYVLSIRAGERDFDVIHEGIFGGARVVRGIVYGASHTIATVGLVVFAWVYWRSLRERSEP